MKRLKRSGLQTGCATLLILAFFFSSICSYSRAADVNSNPGHVAIKFGSTPVVGENIPISFEITIGDAGLKPGGKIEGRWANWRTAWRFEIQEVACKFRSDQSDFFKVDTFSSQPKKWPPDPSPISFIARAVGTETIKPGTKLVFSGILNCAKHISMIAKYEILVSADANAEPSMLAGDIQIGPCNVASVASINCIAEARPLEGKEARITVAAIDQYGNPITDFEDTVNLSCNIPVDMPKRYTFTKEDAGSHGFHVVFPQNIVSRVKVSCQGISTFSNPILPRKADEPAIYFGDIHAHSEVSDGIGDPACGYEYAEKFNGLDFAAFTDHDPSGENWKRIIETGNRCNRDGIFVTLLGYEYTCSLQGHRNFIYRGDKGPQSPMRIPERANNIRAVWDYFDQEGITVLTIANHPNVQSKELLADGIPVWRALDWSEINNKYQRLVEIYQVLGSFEIPRGLNEDLKIRSQDCGASVQAALSMGHRVGFVGATDTHLGRPGNDGGRTAVIVENLTRTGLWEGLYNRSCYATSGPHILVFLTLNHRAMGSEVVLSQSQDSRIIQWRVIGTTTLKKIELLRNNIVIESWDGDSKDDLSGEFVARGSLDATEWWYLRVIQDDGNLAWSSPIWVDIANAKVP